MSIVDKKERDRRIQLCGEAKEIISKTVKIEDAREMSLFLNYSGFYLQISFSEIHPLMIFHLAKHLDNELDPDIAERVNDINLECLLGTHLISSDMHCYLYRASHWLDAELSGGRFLEMLDRCVEEAKHGYMKIASE